MKSVVVTGGSGKAGRAVIRELIEHGYAVMNVDVDAARPTAVPFLQGRPDRPRARPWRPCVAPPARLIGGVRRSANSQAIVHLAGIPAPSLAADAVTFQNNLMSTYNVFSAATLFGLKRVVWASSETRVRPAADP